MDKDERCCGSGACIINGTGLCWCGHQWNGTTMCHPETTEAPEAPKPTTQPLQSDAAQRETP